jgi:hypothetical protein
MVSERLPRLACFNFSENEALSRSSDWSRDQVTDLLTSLTSLGPDPT